MNSVSGEVKDLKKESGWSCHTLVTHARMSVDRGERRDREMTGLEGSGTGAGGVGCGAEKGNKQVKDEKNDRVRSRRCLGEDGDQLFSFTVGDPGSLSGGITCRTDTDERPVKSSHCANKHGQIESGPLILGFFYSAQKHKHVKKTFTHFHNPNPQLVEYKRLMGRKSPKQDKFSTVELFCFSCTLKFLPFCMNILVHVDASKLQSFYFY